MGASIFSVKNVYLKAYEIGTASGVHPVLAHLLSSKEKLICPERMWKCIRSQIRPERVIRYTEQRSTSLGDDILWVT
jgi:hypothetical protein